MSDNAILVQSQFAGLQQQFPGMHILEKTINRGGYLSNWSVHQLIGQLISKIQATAVDDYVRAYQKLF